MGTAPGSGVQAGLEICITMHLWDPKNETHRTLDPKACCPFASTPTSAYHILCFKGLYILTRQPRHTSARKSSPPVGSAMA